MKKYYIELTKGQRTLVDKEDFEWLNEFKWYAQVDRKTGKYTARRGTLRKGIRKMYQMHRVIMKCPDHLQIDHINHDTLDNRKANLRICTGTDNNRNRPKFNKNKPRGCYKTPYGTWNVRISVNNVAVNIGNFKTEKEAVQAYRQAAIKYHGEFACLD